MSRNVHVVGTGTIGAPLTHLIARHAEELGVDRVTFEKKTPLLTDRSRVQQLILAGAILASEAEAKSAFEALEMAPGMVVDEARSTADVIIDCTPFGNKHKSSLYSQLTDAKGFIAQGSEKGFGLRYARGINDAALESGERYIQVVSCNTHALSRLIRTLGQRGGEKPDNLKRGKFLCVRRSNDISQPGGLVPAPQSGKAKHPIYGTHHAEDAHDLFATVEQDLNLFSRAIKVPTQYMHLVEFDLEIRDATTVDELVGLVKRDPHMALTYKDLANQVFSFGREFGFYGRILNQAVINPESLHVLPLNGGREGYQITGTCFTPQDGNSLLSSVAAMLWFMDRDAYGERLQCLERYVYDEV